MQKSLLRNASVILTGALFCFALSFTFFAVQSGDALMYLSLARDYLQNGAWPTIDPYLYSLPHAELHTAHEYLSYLVFYFAYSALGFAGLIVLKMLLYALLFGVVLEAPPRKANQSWLWILLFAAGTWAASFRFIERSSLFSDLFCVLLIAWLTRVHKATWKLGLALAAFFLLWIQLHPGYPLGLCILALWTLWHAFTSKEFRSVRVLWLALPVLILLANPLFLEGALYPFRFALNEAQTLKHFNYEWFPTYSKTFRFTPETIGFWILLLIGLVVLISKRAVLTLRGILIVFSFICGVQAVRFVPWASFAALLLIKPLVERWRLSRPALQLLVAALALGVAVKNVAVGYTGSSGVRKPKLTLDENFFPIQTVSFLRQHRLPGQLYNAHDFGSYLIWEKLTPIFHHGFVTDMNFYYNDVVGVFKSQANFLELQRKYGWTMLLIDKHGSYPYFYKILSPLPDWKIVAEDDASYLIYYLPAQH